MTAKEYSYPFQVTQERNDFLFSAILWRSYIIISILISYGLPLLHICRPIYA
jgi:hypothetical protein